MTRRSSDSVPFYTYKTAYEERRNDPHINVVEEDNHGRLHQVGNITIGQAMTPAEFYRWEMESLCKPIGRCLSGADEMTYALRLTADGKWQKSGDNYYRIMPDILPLLLRTELSVPSSRLRLPYPSILIRLPIGHGQKDLLDPSGGELRTIMVCETAPDTVVFLMDAGMHSDRGPQVFWHLESLTDERTIDDFLANGQDMTPTFGQRRPLARNCVRIAASVIFMATGADRMIEVDVLNRDVEKYYDPTTREEDRERMRRRAKRMPGHNGHVVGRDHRRRDVRLPRNGRDGTHWARSGRRLHYQHTRCGHHRFFLKGDGSIGYTWVKSAVVRPDLPPHPDERGYAVGE